jgi:methylenetetrahydrofolate dehydrogenase (NADP+)/methenyltetrahydrofolate cyclohydrolase
MSARILTGHALADRLLAQAADRAAAFRTAQGRAPMLALVGGDAPSAQAYISRIIRFAERTGVATRIVPLPGDTASAIDCIRALNGDAGVDGILILSPLPAGVALADVAAVLDPAKDVDGLTADNAGRLARGLAGLFPCTPQAAILLAEDAAGALRGQTVTVVGASVGVGRPLAELLLQRGATVTIAHVDTRDLAAACRSAGILFVAVGKAGLIPASHVAPGAVVIDIGINAVDDGDGGTMIVGDVDAAGIAAIARAISAVPDGVGPLTAAFLIDNVVAAATARPAATDARPSAGR